MAEQINSGDYLPVQLSDVISEVKSMLEITETTEHDPDLYKWAYDSLYKMNALQTMVIKNVTLDIEDGEADLPPDMLQFLALRFCDEHGRSYGIYLSDFNFLKDCNCSLDGEYESYQSYFMINDSKLVLKYHGEDMPKKVVLAYRGAITDQEGFRVIYSYMSDAVVNYVCSRFTLKYYRIPMHGQRHALFTRNWKAQHDRVISKGAHQDWIKNRQSLYFATHQMILSI